MDTSLCSSFGIIFELNHVEQLEKYFRKMEVPFVAVLKLYTPRQMGGTSVRLSRKYFRILFTSFLCLHFPSNHLSDLFLSLYLYHCYLYFFQKERNITR